MITSSTYIAGLIYRHLNGTISAAGVAELQAWSDQSPENERFLAALTDETDLTDLIVFNEAYERNNMQSSIYQTIRSQISFSDSQPVTKYTPRAAFIRRWWAAAAVLLVLTTGVYFWGQKLKIESENLKVGVTRLNNSDIDPGKEGAILTLADGSQVILDSLDNSVIALQNGSQASVKDGELVYDVTGEAAGKTVYNTMTTPKGRQYQVMLPDGTRVWLNAASSIRYPTVFTGQERKVTVRGEAYFEVAPNAKMPFRLNVDEKVTVEVLGTHFNINGYENEATINTTLLEGSIKVNGTRIRPGQQAQVVNVNDRSADGITAKGEIKMIDNADIDKVISWKNGFIYFDGVALDEIMRQLERWYDIQVVYENNKIPNKQLAGGMTRDVSLNGLLKYLGKMDVRYKLDGRTLIISP